MAIPNAKKKKKKKQQLTPTQRIAFLEAKIEELENRRLREFMLTVEMMEGIFMTDMWTVMGWREKRISERLFSHLMLFSEVSDGRITPVGVVNNTKHFSGIDLQILFDRLNSGGEITQEHLQKLIKEARIRNEKEEKKK